MQIELPDELFTEEELKNTPGRYARFLKEWTHGSKNYNFTTFPNTEDVHDLVVVRNIPFSSLCAHHLMLFEGVAHVGYVPGKNIVGLSKIPRLVQEWSNRPQNQERLTKQIADDLMKRLEPWGCMVVMQASHSCMSARGVKAHGADTVTSAQRGKFETEPDAKAEFFQLVGMGK